MPGISIGVSAIGVKEQVQRFTNISGNFEAWRIAEIINYCLQNIEDGAKSKAPVLTGTLRDSIGHFMISENFPLIAGECYVGVDYGAAVEYGYVGSGGNRVPGRNYFTPSAIRGQNLFNKMMKEYMQANVKGVIYTPPSAPKGKARAHKYQSVTVTATGKKRYKYAPDRGTVSRRYFIRQPGGRKQPSTRFGRPRGGGSSFRRG